MKNLSKYGGHAYHDCFENCIVYTVDGKSYKKYVDDNENGAVHIYYRLDNPNIIKTVTEVKQRKREAKKTSSLVAMIVLGLIVMGFSMPFFVIGIAKVTHTPIGNTYYV